MITNLLATVVVTLVTNVSERWPQHQVMLGSESRPLGYGGLMVDDGLVHFRMDPDANPTNKWVRTTIARDTTIKFDFDGPHDILVKHELLSDVEVEQRLESKWLDVATNAVPANGYLEGNRWQSYGSLWVTNAVYVTNGLVPLTNAWVPMTPLTNGVVRTNYNSR